MDREAFGDGDGVRVWWGMYLALMLIYSCVAPFFVVSTLLIIELEKP